MGKDKNKENKDGKIEEQFVRALHSLESKVESLEATLKENEKSSNLLNEDQLFFGLVLSLALLLLTIPTFDVSVFFENFGFKIQATEGVISARVFLIAALIFAAGCRYSVALARKDAWKSRLRVYSVALLVFSFYWLIFDLLNRGLRIVLDNVNPYLSPIAPGSSVLFILSFAIVEKKWYSKYEDYPAYVSFIFAFLSLLILFLEGFGKYVLVLIPSLVDSVRLAMFLLAIGLTSIVSFLLMKHYKPLKV
jgi:hypothetical protein